MITIIVGDTTKEIMESYKGSSVRNQRPYTFMHTTAHPRDLNKIAANIVEQNANVCVLTHTLFLIRALMIQAHQANVPVQYLFKGELSDDFPAGCDLVDYELKQSDAYIDMENGL